MQKLLFVVGGGGGGVYMFTSIKQLHILSNLRDTCTFVYEMQTST